MTRIGLLSDTHGYLDDKILNHLKDCDVIWHAGDIGEGMILEPLKKITETRAVWGNIDSPLKRKELPETDIFYCEDFKILMIHIAGKFESYTPQVRTLLKEHEPEILICGHSHILKIAQDKKLNLMYINPGAAGIYGFHTIRTLLLFDMDKHNISNLRVVEMRRDNK